MGGVEGERWVRVRDWAERDRRDCEGLEMGGIGVVNRKWHDKVDESGCGYK